MRGAGGTEGGIGRFLLGLAMLTGGGYLLLNAIQVRSGFGLGHALWSFGWGSITTGMVLVPFIIGVAFLFYDAKNLLGWLLSGGSLLAMILGVITSLRFTMRPMTSFELITILVLVFGGLGLFLSSLRDYGAKTAPAE